MSVLLKTLQKTYKVQIDHMTTVQDLAELVLSKHWVTYQDFSFMLNGSILNNSASIIPGTVFLVLPRADSIDYFDLAVSYYDQVICFQCPTCMTGARLKFALAPRAFLNPESVRLWHNGTELPDSALVTSAFADTEEKKLVLESLERVEVRDGINVTIKTLIGRTFELQVTSDMMVDELKALISEKIQVYRDDIKLVAQGMSMADSTISYRHIITPRTTIYVVSRLRPD